MASGNRFDFLAAWWFELVSWLVKPFTRCGDDDRCIFTSQFARFNGELWELVVEDGAPVYVYYCPWCGRKLKK